MSEPDRKPNLWSTHYWAGDSSHPEISDNVEHSTPMSRPAMKPDDCFRITGPVTIPTGSLPNPPSPAVDPDAIAPPAQGQATQHQRKNEDHQPHPSEVGASTPLASESPSRPEEPSKSRALISRKGAALIGAGLALNLVAVSVLLGTRNNEPNTLGAEVLDSDDYADEDSLRIEIPLGPKPSETESTEVGTDVNENLAPLQIVIIDGKVIVQGTTTSEEQAQGMIAEAESIFAGVPIVKEYTIDPSAPSPERGVVVQKPVVFESGSSVIRDEFKPILDACADVMKQNPTLIMNVNGHTDSDGSAKYNLELAESRAQAVIDYYASKGLDADKFTLDALGEDEPIDSNTTENGKEENRRTDLEFEGVFDEVLEETGS